MICILWLGKQENQEKKELWEEAIELSYGLGSNPRGVAHSGVSTSLYRNKTAWKRVWTEVLLTQASPRVLGWDSISPFAQRQRRS